MFEPGACLEFRYPIFNRCEAHLREFRQRQVKVLRVRDLVRDPLTTEEFLRRPYVIRSRWLVDGVENGRYRKFYLGASPEFAAPSELRLGLYEPFADRPSKILIRPVLPTIEDRRALVRLLLKWSGRDFGDCRLGIFADDMRLRSVG